MKTWQAGLAVLFLTAGTVSAETVVPTVVIGSEAPDFTLSATDGTSRTLSSLRGEKNVVLIFFRGTW